MRGEARALKSGVVVGKFYPPHRGHKFLIDEARKQVDHLYVFVCAHQDQLIPGTQRLEWMNRIHPNCDVRLVDDTLPEDPQAWALFVQSYLGFSPDVVFTSEDYGDAFAHHLGAKHICVDRARCQVPVSGSSIRSAPHAHWDFMEPCVRGYFATRVVLVGAESTGKSTLARRLAEHFNTTWVPEFGREYCEINEKLDKTWLTGEFDVIATIQQTRENRIAEDCNRILICDTNATATSIWHERYLGFRSPTVDLIATKDRSDLYLLSDPSCDFVQDGTRDGELIRDWMHERFRKRLTNYTMLTGSWEQRFGDAIAAIKSI
ncbi:MAG: AAA family ATPase [Fimbriimonadaceae bacterium]